MATVQTRNQFIDPEALMVILTRNQRKEFKALTNAEAEAKLKRKRPQSKESDVPYPARKRRKKLPKIKVTEVQPVTEGPLIIDIDYIIERQKKDSYIRRIWKLAQKKKVYEPTIQEIEDSEDLTMINGV